MELQYLQGELLQFMVAVMGGGGASATAAPVVAGSFDAVLMDGQLLCRFLRRLDRSLVPRIHERLDPFFMRENVAMFVQGCRKFGLPDAVLFEPDDLLEHKNLRQVTNCIAYLCRRAFRKGLVSLASAAPISAPAVAAASTSEPSQPGEKAATLSPQDAHQQAETPAAAAPAVDISKFLFLDDSFFDLEDGMTPGALDERTSSSSRGGSNARRSRIAASLKLNDDVFRRLQQQEEQQPADNSPADAGGAQDALADTDASPAATDSDSGVVLDEQQAAELHAALAQLKLSLPVAKDSIVPDQVLSQMQGQGQVHGEGQGQGWRADEEAAVPRAPRNSLRIKRTRLFVAGSLFRDGSADSVQWSTPQEVTCSSMRDASPVVKVACGGGHVLLLCMDGSVLSASLGLSENQRLGRAAAEQSGCSFDQISFGMVAGFGPSTGVHVQDICCGSAHSLCLTDDGRVFSFGLNVMGQCGIPTAGRHVEAPQMVAGLPEPVRAIAAGFAHSLFVGESGQLYACGWSGAGQTGLNPAEMGILANNNIAVPTKVSSVSGNGWNKVVQPAAGYAHSLLLTEHGMVLGAGARYAGQLADVYLHPARVSVLPSSSSSSSRQTIHGTDMQLSQQQQQQQFDAAATAMGDDETQHFFAPLDSFVDHPASLVRCGPFHSLLLTKRGLLFGFGRISECRLGGKETTGPTGDCNIEGRAIRLLMDISSSSRKVRDMSAGKNHNIVLFDDGEIYALGNNRAHQCGLASPVSCSEWTSIPFAGWLDAGGSASANTWRISSVCCGDEISFFLAEED